MGALSQVLRHLPEQNDPNLLVGPEHHSDAGVYRVRDDLAILQTVDFFSPLTNDPYVFGQIAAANSLSDIYAMGGNPITALNVVAFPDDQLPLAVLDEILRGAAEKIHEAGAVLLGGHTVRDTEIKYGLAVTGLAAPEKVITNAGARTGDVLVLTKPIGTGAMTVAYRKGKIDAEIWESCCDSMCALNQTASRAMVAAKAHAATDITGFGLLGHASEVASASGKTLEFEANAVPLLRGARELAAKGFITRAASSNHAYLEGQVEFGSEVEQDLLNLITDAETSGGLLVSLDERNLGAFGDAFGDGSVESWTRVGRVMDESDVLVRVV